MIDDIFYVNRIDENKYVNKTFVFQANLNDNKIRRWDSWRQPY